MLSSRDSVYVFYNVFLANQRRVHPFCVAKLPNQAESLGLQHAPVFFFFLAGKLIPREVYVHYLTIFSGYASTHIALMLTQFNFVRKFV